MKRIIAISFLSLATMIIVAHAIIPHHHHDGIPMLLSSQMHKTMQERHHDCSCDDIHSQDDNHCHSNEECPIYDYSVIPENERIINASSNNDIFQTFTFIVLLHKNPIIEISEYRNLSFREKPYSESYHTVYITNSLGLRAPPVC